MKFPCFRLSCMNFLIRIFVIHQVIGPFIIFVYKPFTKAFEFHTNTLCQFHGRGVIHINMSFYAVEFQMFKGTPLD